MKNWALHWPTCERHTVVESFDDALSNAAFSFRGRSAAFFCLFLSFSFIFLQTASRGGIMKSARFATSCRISKNCETASLNRIKRRRNVKRRREQNRRATQKPADRERSPALHSRRERNVRRRDALRRALGIRRRRRIRRRVTARNDRRELLMKRRFSCDDVQSRFVKRLARKAVNKNLKSIGR